MLGVGRAERFLKTLPVLRVEKCYRHLVRSSKKNGGFPPLLWLPKPRDTQCSQLAVGFLHLTVILENQVDWCLMLTAVLLAQSASLKVIQMCLWWFILYLCGLQILLFPGCYLRAGIPSQPAVHYSFPTVIWKSWAKNSHLWESCESLEILILELQCRCCSGSLCWFPRDILSCTFEPELFATFLLLPSFTSICSSSVWGCWCPHLLM